MPAATTLSATHGLASGVVVGTIAGANDAYADPESFTLVREVARGGMGVIVEARDVRHDRVVALKLLLRQTEVSRERFAREVRITAALQHPNIVPLYEAGTLPTGEPFFAMKLVSGPSLKQAIDEATTLAGRLALVPHVAAVADAVAYAHRRGVVHRDLKPSNVLIGPFRETVVIDWGLAKDIRDDAERAPRAASAGDPMMTAEGSTLGTPSYMPPEQAWGEAVDARADVYAVGAMLHHVIAGQPPHLGDTADEALDRARSMTPKPVDLLEPGVPPELAAIVRKAMARERADRYATAEDLAADLRRFLDGGRVDAHTYSARALAMRWARRHRAVLTVATLAVAALAALSVAGVHALVAERNRTALAAARAEKGRAEAMREQERAEALVDFMLGSLDHRLKPLGKLELLEEVGAHVDQYYDRPDARLSDESTETLRRRIAALQTLLEVDIARGDAAAARRHLAQLGAFVGEAQRRSPDDPTALYDAGRERLLRARVDYLDDDTGSVLRDARAAEDAARALQRVSGDDPRAALLFGGAARLLTRPLEARGEGALARSEHLAALTLLEAARAKQPEDEAILTQTGDTLYFLAETERGLRAFDAAGARQRESLAVRERLLRTNPAHVGWRLDANWNRHMLGHIAFARGDSDEARRWLTLSHQERLKVAAQEPQNPEHQLFVVDSYTDLGDLYVATGELAAAESAFREGEAIASSLLTAHPNRKFALFAAVLYTMGADLDLRLSRPERALEDAARGLSLLGEEQPEPRAELLAITARAHQARGEVTLAQRDAEAAMGLARATLTGAAPVHATVSFAQIARAYAEVTGDHAAAHEALTQGGARLLAALENHPSDVELLYEWAMTADASHRHGGARPRDLAGRSPAEVIAALRRDGRMPPGRLADWERATRASPGGR